MPSVKQGVKRRLIGRLLLLAGVVALGFGFYPPYQVTYACGPYSTWFCHDHYHIQLTWPFFIGVALLASGAALTLRARGQDQS